jgi:hypothetical protein
MSRVYVAATLRGLASLARHGSLRVDPDDLVVAPDESEDSEYDALMTAAETSAVLAADLEDGERRRVVVVAEVTGVDAASGLVHVGLADVVAVHADVTDLPADGESGELDELGWYATQEIDDLLEA